MPDGVALQADIGSLGLSGLGAFTTILGAMSKDNVQPTAMMLLDSLGSLLPVNGQHANRVPEVMERAVTHPVGRLSLAVGWRRGDAISVFAETAGGQAITLLTTCLVNIFEDRHYGLVLSRLCTSLLPNALPRSSPIHMANIAKLVAAKAAPLAFGNILAQQTHRVLSVYQQLQIQSPNQLLEPPSVDSTVQLFEKLAHLQKDENSFIRISGSTSILYIIAMIIFMFPSSTMVAVESIIIHDNRGARIIIEVLDALTQVQVETELEPHQVLVASPLVPLSRVEYGKEPLQPSLQWDGWLKHALCLHLARFGLTLTQDLQEAFCEFMVQIAPHLRLCNFGDSQMRLMKKVRFFKKGFVELLGPHFQYKLARTCREICHYDPHQGAPDPVARWETLLEVLERDFDSVKCTCGKCVAPIFTWTDQRVTCSRHNISRIMGSALASGILCSLIEPQGPVTMALNYDEDLLMGPVVLHVLGKLGLQGVDPIRLSKHFCQTKKSGPGTLDGGVTELNDARYKGHRGVFRGIFDMVYPSPRSLNDPLLGHSSRGHSIYPTVLDSLRVEPEGCFTFRITEGLFIHKGVYYNSLCDETKRPRCDSIARLSTELSPLSISKLVEPLSLSVSLREGFEEILLTFNVQRAGLYFHVSAFDAVVGLMCLDTTPNCEHDMDDVLREEYETQVTVKSVGEASNQDYKLAITMTARNPQAQFLACGSGTQGDLLLQCCLNCGVQQALEGGYTNLIAT